MSSFSSDETLKNSGSKYAINKYDHDFYHQENDVVTKVYRVKYAKDPEHWKVFEDKVELFKLHAEKLSSEQKEFFYSVKGSTFLIQCCKDGIFSEAEAILNLKTLAAP